MSLLRECMSLLRECLPLMSQRDIRDQDSVRDKSTWSARQKYNVRDIHSLKRDIHSLKRDIHSDSVRDKSTWSSTLHTLLRDGAHSHTVLVSRLSLKRGECVSTPRESLKRSRNTLTSFET